MQLYIFFCYCFFQTDRTRVVTALDAALQSPSGKDALAPAHTTAASVTETASANSSTATGRSTDSRQTSHRYHSSATGSQSPECQSGEVEVVSPSYSAPIGSRSESVICARCAKEKDFCLRDCSHTNA